MPDLDRLAQFDADGLRFQYPGNWRVVKDSKPGEGISADRIVVLKGRGSELCRIFIWDNASEISLEECSLNPSFVGEGVGRLAAKGYKIVEINGEQHPVLFMELPAEEGAGKRMEFFELSRNGKSLYVITQAFCSGWPDSESGFHVVYSTIDY